jgi:pimeloyl-ACP methyl ester carboxylesterase
LSKQVNCQDAAGNVPAAGLLDIPRSDAIQNTMRRKKAAVKVILLVILVPVVAFILPLVFGQSRMIYFPRPYGGGDVARFKKAEGAAVIDYQTTDGAQQAYLYSPSEHPERLWILCGGNGTVALDWLDWIQQYAPKRDAWLLFDMPGYGASTGNPNPWSIRRSLKAVVPAAEQALGWQAGAAKGRLRFFGHSLGAAVVLMAADEYGIHRGVLLTPFTSTMDMAKVVTRLPLRFLVWQRFDNEAELRKISESPDGKVFIFHGDQDEAIPVEMSRKMAAEFPGMVTYHEIPGGRHNTLQDKIPSEIVAALEEARK